MRLAQQITIVVIVLMAPLWAGADDKKPGADPKALRGKWTVVSSEAGGKKLTKDQLLWQWTFTDDGKATLADRKTGKDSRYIYSVDASKEPHAIDIVYQGPEPALKDIKQLGVYKIEDNRLTLCFNLPGVKERPKEFATQAGSGFLLRLERTKDK